MIHSLLITARLAALAAKNLVRNRLSTLLTLVGIAAGMFLYTGVEALQGSLSRTLRAAADESALTVYQRDRFCPNTSLLRESYATEIMRHPKLRELGVTAAHPMLVRVSNCGAGLDAVTFRGVEPAYVHSLGNQLQIVDGSAADWPRRRDAALVPESFAAERHLKVGDQFEAAGITVYVAAITRSQNTEAQTSLYVPLEFLQQQSVGLGTVTLLHVQLADSSKLDAAAAAIDSLYHAGPVETHTHTQKEFFTHAAGQMLEIISYSRGLGPISLLAVLAIMANSAMLTVRRRMKEAAIYQTIGWQRRHVAMLSLWEGALLGLVGGLLGSLGCRLMLALCPLHLSNEGVSLVISADASTLLTAVGASVLIGIAATLWPTIRSTCRPPAESLR